jgi:endonuclease-3
VAVDTHIFGSPIAPASRRKRRLGGGRKTAEIHPAGIPAERHHWLILHGALRLPRAQAGCPQCLIRDLCEFRPKTRDV